MKKSTIDSAEVAKFSQLAAQWWNANGPLKTLHDINPARINFIEKFINVKEQRVLDVGCGGGILSEGLAALGADVTGLDVEEEAIHAACAHAQESGLDIDYLCMPIEEYDQAPFAVITCMEMLEHVTEPQLVIKHCARLLKQDGYLFLSTINRTFAAYLGAVIAAEYVLELLPRQTHDYKKFIKPSELAAMVREAGMETVGIAGMSYNPLTRTASLQDSVSINYLFACRKL
ncbi:MULTISPECIES: bifunctional 2-polyprenyl-6-hydroxyphenol methylase/3-demethylubiquinol 3-O-methyltransferase UbiG [Legionella]|uniref:bifunctional 2-polyprenyl-6-hydroxyphenol methylase/3-demethylubiquinol 3-O-methyltransferase UbiG n=1 Tax=Legionella TaxID=445 RepID=UPI000F8DF858|nr:MULTISPECIES: bifunctional 2-polyprenyl-6-hydroxyphenol methylase/3-demethylubiquinol 3-O-methyltransferase UbiG [Legionella]MCP0913438.1 bifunctional 2-polyprenyl-6-hydroxyphenol methylase/3-demethylubiquinol 3-O-methyltransferase UbiG [Legionella sp. 27cVA30]RUR09827.1 bifunctional 2-polyprenyl-6-hydroxyphenol methylase/3-demethylubiquinol 3-O-methyltransferase UbiG [Legionella septentrionalis]RUR13628.1 bifunctional 2-polyprenyl-6-hydroxyphenol methylase/3-demethylubiquinol 3-O-methyltrans